MQRSGKESVEICVLVPFSQQIAPCVDSNEATYVLRVCMIGSGQDFKT